MAHFPIAIRLSKISLIMLSLIAGLEALDSRLLLTSFG